MEREAPQRTEIARGRRRRRSVGGLSLALMLVVLSLSAVSCSDPLDKAVELEKAGDLEGALAVYEEILQDDPENVAALSAEAVCLLQLHRYDEALALQEKVIALDPADVFTRVELGFNYLNHQDRPADAVRVLAEATVLEPSAKYLVYLAQAQEAAGELGSAENTLRRALGADPAYGRTYSQLAALLEEQGRDQEAKDVRQQAFAQGIDIEDVE